MFDRKISLPLTLPHIWVTAASFLIGPNTFTPLYLVKGKSSISDMDIYNSKPYLNRPSLAQRPCMPEDPEAGGEGSKHSLHQNASCQEGEGPAAFSFLCFFPRQT